MNNEINQVTAEPSSLNFEYLTYPDDMVGDYVETVAMCDHNFSVCSTVQLLDIQQHLANYAEEIRNILIERAGAE